MASYRILIIRHRLVTSELDRTIRTLFNETYRASFFQCGKFIYICIQNSEFWPKYLVGYFSGPSYLLGKFMETFTCYLPFGLAVLRLEKEKKAIFFFQFDFFVLPFAMCR